MKYYILLFYISYTQKKKKIIYSPPKDKFLAPPLQKMFSVSITHNSKIRELSDGNKKLKTELWLAKQTFFEN